MDFKISGQQQNLSLFPMIEMIYRLNCNTLRCILIFFGLFLGQKIYYAKKYNWNRCQSSQKSFDGFFFNFRRNRMRFEVNTFWLCFKANKKLWFDDEKKKYQQKTHVLTPHRLDTNRYPYARNTAVFVWTLFDLCHGLWVFIYIYKWVTSSIASTRIMNWNGFCG